MWGKTQGLGVTTADYLVKYYNWHEIPKVGDVYGDMIVTNVNAEARAVHLCIAELKLSKDFNRISEYVNVNSKYRQWAIPGDGYVERILHYQDYLIIDEKYVEGSLSCTNDFRDKCCSVLTTPAQNYELNCLSLYRSNSKGVVLSCQGIAVGNSLVFSARTQDNLSAGVQVEGSGGDSQSKMVQYCNDDGTIENAKIVIGNQIVSYTQGLLQESAKTYKTLPESWRTPTDLYRNSHNEVEENYFLKNFVVKKDSAEQLSFVYQLHIVSNLKSIIIGPLLTENNPLIKNLPGRRFRFWSLKKKISKHCQIVSEQDGDMVDWNNFTRRIAKDWIITIKYDPGVEIGWAITDDNGRLYLAENKPFAGKREIYFCFRDER